MEIHVKHTSVVRPAEETPNRCLWNSDFDRLTLLSINKAHVPLVYFYRLPSDRSDHFFETCVLKEGLSKALVAFYPLAGRLARDKNGRQEIACNGEGALFVEAETSCIIDDEFGDDDFSPSLKMKQLVPTIDCSSTDISSFPLLVIQVTYFKCGGVCLGIGWHRVLGDGISAFHFIKTWAEMTRGISTIIPPFIDPTILHARTPSYFTFNHIEYHPPPSMNHTELQTTPSPTSTSMARLKFSLDQIDTLKAKFKKDHGVTYSTYEILAAHIWRCVCKARGLSDDRATKLYIPTNGRARLNPPLPYEYFGNIMFIATSIALTGDIQSKSLIHTVKLIHEALKRMDDNYLRSALAYMKEHVNDLAAPEKGTPIFSCPNLKITSWLRMPLYDTDFGWGHPIYMGRAIIPYEGSSYIMLSSSDEKSLSLIICLETHHMQLFKKFFYSEGVGPLKKFHKPSSL